MNIKRTINFSSIFFLLCWGCSNVEEPINFNQFNLKQIEENAIKADTLHNQGMTYFDEDQYDLAIQTFENVIQVRESLIPHFSDSLRISLRDSILLGVIKGYNNIGYIYDEMKKYSLAEEALLNCLDKYKTYNENWGFHEPKRAAWANHSIGTIYLENRDLETAKAKLNEGVLYAKLANDTSKVGDLFYSLSYLFNVWKEPDSSIFYSKKALVQYSMLEDKIAQADAFNSLGVAYELKKEHYLALDAYSKAETLLKREGAFTKEDHNILALNKSIVLNAKGDYEGALKAIETAINIIEQEEQTEEIDLKIATRFSAKADIFLKQEDFDNSYVYYNEALEKYKKYYPDLSLFSLSPNTKIDLLHILTQYSVVLSNQDSLEKALQNSNRTIQLINQARRDFKDNSSKIKLAGINKKVFESAIDVAQVQGLKYWDEALAYAENSKAFTLLEGVKHYKALDIAGVDPGLIKQENELRIALDQVKEEISYTEDTEELIQLRQKQQTIREELDQLTDQLRQNENYRKLVLEFDMIPVLEIQRDLLADDQALVEYFVGDEATYIFAIDKEHFEVKKVEMPKEALELWVDSLWAGIYFSPMKKADMINWVGDLYPKGQTQETLRAQYDQKGQWLYDSLFAWVEERFPNQRYIIVPDGKLNYIPFETLLRQKPERSGNFHNYDFVGKDKAISYSYSATLLKEMKSANQVGGNKILAIAPTFPNQNRWKRDQELYAMLRNDVLDTLRYNLPEVDHIAGLFGRKVDLRTQNVATRDDFLSKIAQNDYRIIHLATHGKANDRDPNYSFISFSQGDPENIDKEQLLYVKDLYHTRIPVDMVVLSACETNRGILRQGEGIMSFTRGLAFAGARSIFSTLWNVPDRYTKDLVVEFYNGLDQTLPKDLALMQAKANILDVDNGKVNSIARHPANWAGLIAIGDMQPIELEEDSGFPTWAWLGLGIVGLGIIFFILWRRRKKEVQEVVIEMA